MEKLLKSKKLLYVLRSIEVLYLLFLIFGMIFETQANEILYMIQDNIGVSRNDILMNMALLIGVGEVFYECLKRKYHTK